MKYIFLVTLWILPKRQFSESLQVIKSKYNYLLLKNFLTCWDMASPSLKFRLALSTKGRTILVDDEGFQYSLHSSHVDRSGNTTCYWRCANTRMCRSLLTVKNGQIIVRRKHTNHQHQHSSQNVTADVNLDTELSDGGNLDQNLTADGNILDTEMSDGGNMDQNLTELDVKMSAIEMREEGPSVTSPEMRQEEPPAPATPQKESIRIRIRIIRKMKKA